MRMLLLKQVDSSGFTFYTNLESRKSRELLSNSAAAMCFHWAPLELQVRVEGRVSGVSAEDADAYFASRARESQLGAWASAQSTVIPHDGDLERSYAAMERRFQGRSVPRPSRWSGFLLVPHAIEFWQGQPHRLHRRELYTLLDGEWKVDRLYP